MKRIFALILALVLVFALASCGNNGDAPSDNGTTTAATTTAATTTASSFVKPANYASVLIVTINPQFKLYLDESGKVLAVEAVNKDAQSFADSISFKDEKFETVVKKIVTTANEKGFVKKNATVSFEIAEAKSPTVNAADILNKAESTAKDTATQLSIEIAVATQKPTDAATTTAATTLATTTAHKHSFAAANCTTPKKCSCGATEGSALGHNYKDGACTRCKAADPNAKYTPVAQKVGRWLFVYLSDKTLYDVSLKLNDGAPEPRLSYGIGDHISTLPEEMREEAKPDCTKFNGEYYYIGRGSADELGSVKENGNTVTVTDSSGNKLVLTRTSETTLKVTSSPASFSDVEKIPVGTILTFTEAQED
ncbi:MAG: hypothetical protein IJF54_06455 [Clostridia bacterium]|nr:hypothetical protein [Clostridia bacterium]